MAAVQTTAVADRDENLAAAAGLVGEAVEAGAEVVVLPELFSVAGSPQRLREGAEPIDGPTMCWASGLAARERIHLVAGSFPELGPDGAVHNTSALFDPAGVLRAAYRKVHLFDVHLDGTVVDESATFSAGDELSVVPLAGSHAVPPSSGAAAGRPGADSDAGWVLGLSICYDLRFPELYRILALRGATIVVVPSAFTAATGPAHWELLLRARAVENAVYVIGAGQVGPLPPGMPACHGHSMIVDPWGTVLAQREEASPGVVLADLDRSRLARVRSALPVLDHRRPAAYVWPDDGGDGNRTGAAGRVRGVGAAARGPRHPR
ncbi:MAG: carbon-nitrogen hydrolase family protein [Acidimicrobiales bacterium]|nr:carbon-nitrogen hydrolase family protein [Acidimicrobiales bacterium]